jgi:hypothetical protein
MEQALANASTRMHWVRIVTGGVLAEAVLIVLLIPVELRWGQSPLNVLAPLGSLVLCFGFGYWVARGAQARFAWHGLLMGVVATGVYLAMTRLGPEPWEYVAAHGLKLAGGAAGGWMAGRGR